MVRKKQGEFPYIDNNKEIEPMWRQGFTKTKKLRSTDNIAAYLMAYLTDVPSDEIIPGAKRKSMLKGARLYFYPSGVHIYRNSRGLIRPKKIKGVKADILFDNGLSRNTLADAAFYKEHKIKDGKKIGHITEFYDNLSKKKKTNQARQDND